MIDEVTLLLSKGKNVLVHCAGGTGRTGMVICGVVRNLGCDQPISFARKVKSGYVETEDQAKFVENMPLTISDELCKVNPFLTKMICTDKIIEAFNCGIDLKDE